MLPCRQLVTPAVKDSGEDEGPFENKGETTDKEAKFIGVSGTRLFTFKLSLICFNSQTGGLPLSPQQCH